MIFKSKYYLKFPKNLFEDFGKKILIGKKGSDIDNEKIYSIIGNINFSKDEDFSFLPSKLGRFSKFNADGKEIVRRDLEKVNEVTMRYYTRWEFHGRDNRVEVEDYYYITYKKYPRDYKDAPNVLVSYTQGYFVLELDIDDDEEFNLHKLNLMLELFGSELTILDINNGFLVEKAKPLRWEILRAGHYTKEELLSRVKHSLSSQKKGVVKKTIEKRLETIYSYENHDEIYCGLAGYMGYIVFIFRDKGIAFLECDRKNNATYIFDVDNWEELSKKSKTEILREDLAKQRIIHNDHWFKEVDRLLK